MSRTFNRTRTSTMTLAELESEHARHETMARALLADAVLADRNGDEEKGIALAKEHANAHHFARRYAKAIIERKRANVQNPATAESK